MCPPQGCGQRSSSPWGLAGREGHPCTSQNPSLTACLQLDPKYPDPKDSRTVPSREGNTVQFTVQFLEMKMKPYTIKKGGCQSLRKWQGEKNNLKCSVTEWPGSNVKVKTSKQRRRCRPKATPVDTGRATGGGWYCHSHTPGLRAWEPPGLMTTLLC